MKTGTGLAIIFLLLFGWAATVISAPSVEEQIALDFAAGKIDYLTALNYQAYLRLDPTRLPVQYRGLEVIGTRSTTLLLMELKQNWLSLDVEVQKLLAPLFDRPVLPLSLVSPGKRFRIHYALEGPDATTDAFVQATAAAFDSAYHYQVEDLGFPAPPADNGLDGSELDVYIVNMPISYYAETIAEDEVVNTSRDDYTSWIRIDNDFTGYYTSGLDGMRVTVAHEFFHMIHIGVRWAFPESQLGYNELFFYEISGVWMEDMMYDRINDYLAYLPNFFVRPTFSFFYFGSSTYAYAQAIWNHYLTKRFGVQTVRDIWLEMMNQDVLSAMESVLSKRNSSFKSALVEYYGWNTITGDLADPVTYYSDGDLYPRIVATDSLEIYSEIEKSSSNNLLAAKYFLFQVRVSGTYLATVNFDDPNNGQFGYLIRFADGTISLNSSTQRTQPLGFIPEGSEIYLIPVNLQMPKANFSSNNHKYNIRLELSDAKAISAKIENIFPNPFFPEQITFAEPKIKIEFYLNKTAPESKAYIFTENGLLIRALDLGVTNQKDSFYWDGKNENGQLVASGVYIVQIVADEAVKPGKIAVIRGH